MGTHQEVHVGYLEDEEIIGTELLFGSSKRALFTVRIISSEMKYYLLNNKIKATLHEFHLTDALFKNWLVLFNYRLQYLSGKLEIMKATHLPATIESRMTHNVHLQKKLLAEKNRSGNQASEKLIIPEKEKANYAFYSQLKDAKMIKELDKRQKALEFTNTDAKEIQFMGEHRLHWDLKSMSKLLNKDFSPLSPEERVMHIKKLFGPGCKALERIIESTDTILSKDIRSVTSIWKKGTVRETSRKNSLHIPIAFKNHDLVVKGLPLKNKASSSFEIRGSQKSRIHISPLFEELKEEKKHRTHASNYVVNSQRILHNRAHSWGELKQPTPKNSAPAMYKRLSERKQILKDTNALTAVKEIRNPVDLVNPIFGVMAASATRNFYRASKCKAEGKKLNIVFKRQFQPF